MEHELNRKQDASPVGSHPARRVRRWLGLALLTVAGLVGGYLLLPLATQDSFAKPLPEIDAAKLPTLMRGWDTPDLALLVSGQMHGYIDPCGCSAPQYGGLTRRYNFVELLKKNGWPVVGVDLGELPQAPGLHEQSMIHYLPQQSMLKYQLSMKALDAMNYRAIGVGKVELAMPLSDALINISNDQIKHVKPLAGSMLEAQKKGDLYFDLGARPFEIVTDAGMKVGIVSLIGPELMKQFPGEKFLPHNAALLTKLEAFAAAGVETSVILYHEYPPVAANNPRGVEAKRHEAAEHLARFCADKRQANAKIPPLSLIVSLTDESEPPGQLAHIRKSSTQLLEIGHKGRHVGMVGYYRGADGPQLKYQLVSIGPEFDTPNGEEKDHPVTKLLEDYTRQLKSQNLLSQYQRVPHATQVDNAAMKKYGMSKYVGSKACEECHKHAYGVWSNTDHASAFRHLAKAKHPSNRQYDGECIVCHTVGFNHPTGYFDLPDPAKLRLKQPAQFAKNLADHNDKLKNVGCESCHGPSSAHVAHPTDASLYELINPYRPREAERKAQQTAKNAATAEARQEATAKHQRLYQMRMRHLDDFCRKCHDTDNDVNWSKVDFLERWIGKGIIHTTPSASPQAAQSK